MKEEMQHDRADAEQLLRTKSWTQLTEDERKAAEEIFSGEHEYERMRNVMLNLRAGAGIEDEELVPDTRVRENLLAAFEDEQRRRRVLWWNSLGFWFRDQLRLDIPAVRIAVAGVILFIGIVAVYKLTESNSNSTPAIVNQDNTKPKPSPQNPSPDAVTPVPQTPQVADQQQKDGNAGDPQKVVPAPDNNKKNAVTDLQNNNGPSPSPVYQPLTLDTNTAVANGTQDTMLSVVPLTISVTPTSIVCCGTSSTVNAATTSLPYNLTWTNNSVTPVTTFNVVTPNNRSLASDQEVVNVFFALK